MKSTIAWGLYSCLTKKEKKYFREWLKIDIEEDASIWVVMNALEKKQSKASTIKRLEEKYPDKKGDDYLRQLTIQIKSRLESYLAYKELKNNEIEKGKLALLQLVKRNTSRNLSFYLNHFRKTSLNKMPRNASFFRYSFELRNIEEEYNLDSNRGQQKYKLEDLNKDFELWYLYQAFILFFAYIIRKKLEIPEKLRAVFIDRTELFKKAEKYAEERFLQYIKNIIVAIENESLDIDIHVNMIYDDNKHFDKEDLLNIFNGVLTYLTQKVNKNGQRQVYEQISDLYSWAYKQKVIYQNKKLAVRHYTNSIITNLRAQRFDQASDIMEKQKRYVSTRHREESYVFNKALTLIFQKKFNQAKTILSKYPFVKDNYKFQSRYFLCQLDYEISIGEQDKSLGIYNNLRALEASLRESKQVSKNVKFTLITRIKYFKKLLNILHQVDKIKKKQNLQKLWQELASSEYLADRYWLTEKVEEAMNQ